MRVSKVRRMWEIFWRVTDRLLVKRGLILSLVLFGILGGFSEASAADGVSVSTSGGYGRMIFTLDPAGAVSAKMTGSVLVVRFPHAVSFRELKILRAMPGYIASARADSDGKVFRFALARPLVLQVSTDGTRYAVDLVPSSFKGMPPRLKPLPKKGGLPPVDMKNLARLPVRSGEYQNFTRLVFDWPKKVSYKVTAGKGKMSVRFGGAAKPDYAAVTRQNPPWVKPTGWKIVNRALVVNFDIDTDSGYHAFYDGTHVVVDVLSPRADAKNYNPPGSGRPKVTMIRPGKQSASAKGGQLDEKQRQAILDTATDVNTPELAAQLTRVPKPQEAGKVMVTGQKTGKDHDSYTIRFDKLTTETKVAAFVRGKIAWVVLESSPQLDISGLKKVRSPLIEQSEADAAASVNILRLVLSKPEQMSASMRGQTLVVQLGPREKVRAGDVRFSSRQDSRARPIYVGTLNGAGQAIRLDDPVIRDHMMVVPGHFGQAVLQGQKHIDFALLPTAAGVAVVPYADDLSVSSSKTQVIISREAGLVIAMRNPPEQEVAAKVRGPEVAAPAQDDGSFLDFANWEKPVAGTFLATERALREKAVEGKGDGPEAARLQLAKFYLANGFDAETLGLLDLLQGKAPKSSAGGQMQIMRAAADYMMGRYKNSHNDLIGPAFDGDRHAALWRGLADEKLGNYAMAYSHLLRASDVIGKYRPDVQTWARLAAAKSALALGHSEDARKQMDQLPAKIPDALKPEAGLVRARLYAAWGDKRMADAHFAEVEESHDPHAAAEAIYYRVSAGLKNGSLTPDEAVNALERLRYRWRGGQLELDTLNLLASLYDKQERWREELRTLHVLARFIPDRDVNNRAQDKMRDLFEDLFLKGKADQMSPVDALGLFYDYIDLTPIGPAGDEMIRHMANRLVNVDLLGPAADLLQYQVDNRLRGTARAQVATSLAAIQLMDHKPKEALNSLLTTRISALPDSVLHRRMLYQARALADLKRWDEALDVLAVDKSYDTEQLRADIYWRSGNWKNAGAAAETLLGNVWNSDKPLSAAQEQLVMRAAVSYAQAGDDAALKRVRARFTLQMMKSPEVNAFAVITQRTDMNGLAFRKAAAQVASIDTLKSFVADLEKKAKE